jgi:hypothetical protein
MRASLVAVVVATGYLILLAEPGLFPSTTTHIGPAGYAILAFGWLIGSVLLAWRACGRGSAMVISALAVAAFLAIPFTVIETGCYVFNQCP